MLSRDRDIISYFFGGAYTNKIEYMWALNRLHFPSMKHGHALVYDTDTYDYIEMCDFLKLLAVSACQCVSCPVSMLHRRYLPTYYNTLGA
jgi:hypothetical protein